MTQTPPKKRNRYAPDYDFGDDVLYKQVKRKDHRSDKDISVLFAMFLFAFLVLGTFIMIKITPGMEFKLGSFFSMVSNKPHPGHILGNVKLGTTMNVLSAQQPNAEKAIAANGAITLAFDEGDARYTVWYGEDGPYHIAYKARQHRAITGMSEDDFIGTIAQRYGAPSVSTCTRRIADGVRDCRFSWWMPGEVRLDLNSRQLIGSTEQRLMVTMTATDTHLESRIRDAQLATSVEQTN